jgi:hypothetical protein
LDYVSVHRFNLEFCRRCIQVKQDTA